jgi:hypothetical protein
MIGAGTIINPIIKVITTILILGAVYLFFVKPALDTTENISNSITESIPGFGSFEELSEGLSGVEEDKLQACLTAAEENAKKLQRCVDRYAK